MIDKVGISKATEIAINKALLLTFVAKILILVDGNIKLNLKYEIRNIVQGDCNYVSVAAASIVAKFIRDTIMIIKSFNHPFYNWNKNKGYGTKEHLLAIKIYGITKFHRKSYNIKVNSFMRTQFKKLKNKKLCLFLGNSLEELKHLETESIDMIFCDPPYFLQLN